MTEKGIAPQQIREFIDNLLDDVRAGRITPEGALVASQQYEYLRSALTEHNDAIVGALSDEKKFRSTITEILEGALVRVQKELPQFQNEIPSQPLSPETIVARAKAFHVAREDSASAVAHQQTRVATLKHNFIDRLVKNWITQTRTTIDKERQQLVVNEIREKLEKAPLDSMSTTEMGGFIQKTLAGSRLGREFAGEQTELIGESKKLTGLRAIPTALVARLNLPHPDWFTSIAIQTGSVSRADTLTRQAETIASSAPQVKGVPDTTIFFRALASTPIQKGLAVVADTILQQLSPVARQEVIKATFSHALDGVLAKTDDLTQRLGRDFVKSELFRLAIDDARKSFARETIPPSGAGQVRGVFEDIIGSVLRGPVPPLVVGTPREMILSYFELLAVEARLPSDRKILFTEHATTINLLFTTLPQRPEFFGVSTPTQKRAGEVLQSSVAALTTQFPSWQVLYMALLSGVSFPRSPSPAAQGQSSVGTPSLTAPLGVFGGIFSSLGGVLSGAAVGLSGGLLTMLFGGGLGALFGRNRGPDKPTPLLEDTPKLLAIIIVVTVVVLFVFPSFLNATFISNAAKNGALLIASVPHSGGPYTDPLPSYEGPFLGGPTAITSCAVDHKHLTQTPFDQGGIGTHSKTCAYDFDAAWGSDVRATHDGCVAAVTSTIKDGAFIRGSYGNYVLLAGTDINGKPFYSLYAHLVQGSSSGLTVGTCVGVGKVLGRVDDTGHSTGTHLHLEFFNENQEKITKEQCSSSFALPAGCTQ